MVFAVGKARAALEALLPSPTQELFNEWIASDHYQSLAVNADHELEQLRWLTQNYTLEKK